MSFRARFVITVVLLIALTFGIGGAMLISNSFTDMFFEARTAAIVSYETIKNTLYVLNSTGSVTPSTISSTFDSLKNQNSIVWWAIALKDSDGRDIYSDCMPFLVGHTPDTPEAGKCSYIVYEESGHHYIQILGNITSPDGGYFTLEVSYDISNPFVSRANMLSMYLKIYAVVILCGIALSLAVSYALTKKLSRLSRAAQDIAAGDLSKRSNIKSNDEVGVLSKQFDSMADSLQSNIEKIEDDMLRQEAFMGAFAHEIKTPMTSIIGYADLIRQDCLTQKDRIEAAGYIFSEGQRLEKLSFKLLDMILLEKDNLTFKNTDLKAFVASIVRYQRPILKGKGVTLSFRCDSGTAVFEPDLVKSLIYNLVDNAAKSIDGAGEINLDAEILPDGCRFIVSDTGRGMEQQELSRITEAFYRVDKSRSRRQGGAGLGLSLCRQIVLVHGGTLTFESVPGYGTTVTARLLNQEVKYEDS